MNHQSSNSPHTEQEQLQRLRRGSDNAFTEIYHVYWKKLYFLAHTHLKSVEASEEIVQDVFMSLWKNRESAQIQSLPFYLAAMTRYTVYRYLAKQRKYTETALTNINEDISNKVNEEAIENKILLEIIEKCANLLPEKCRLVFVHNKLLDKPLQQVADELDISIKTAEAHLTKGLKIIRGKMGDALILLLFL